jgi:hypothetical protein
LIEFKLSVSGVASALIKFTNHGLAKEALQSKDNQHQIAFASAPME